MFGKKMVEGTAWCHCKYIVEVRPDSGAAFRAETKAKVPYLGGPDDGDVVNCKYDPESHKRHGTRGSTPTRPSSGYTPLDPELQALMDADADEAERSGAVAAAPSASPAAPASRLDQLKQLGELRDQGVLSAAAFEPEKARILSES